MKFGFQRYIILSLVYGHIERGTSYLLFSQTGDRTALSNIDSDYTHIALISGTSMQHSGAKDQLEHAKLPQIQCTGDSMCSKDEYCYDTTKSDWLKPFSGSTGLCLGLQCTRKDANDEGQCRPGQQCAYKRQDPYGPSYMKGTAKTGRCLDAKPCSINNTCAVVWHCVSTAHGDHFCDSERLKWDINLPYLCHNSGCPPLPP
jgi:hypothetical protein